ncbi:MAG: DUF3336 domain-containing protein [Sphingomonadaceae bacterium]|nr:DUF3336 domain-containing protein [Sphingomonadaceae bacterium]
MTKTVLHVEKPLEQARSYADWAKAAQALDAGSGKKSWREAESSALFDYRSIRRRLDLLTDLRERGDNQALLFTLNEGIHGNMDGIANEQLWRETRFGTKQLIHDYVDAVVDALDHLASEEVDEIPFEEKLDFFHRASHCYGCSALLLSGSGSFLYFHVGVARALLGEGLLPSIISGSSGGSAVGAMLCTHSDEELVELLEVNQLHDMQHHEPSEGVAGLWLGDKAAQEQVAKSINRVVPDLTFQQAWELTGRHLNISIAPAEKHQNGRLLNAITSPNVCIREAVLASCAVPGVYPPVTLMARDHRGRRVPYLPDRQWVDGSVTHDLPTKRLSRLYGVNHHIVSQANPLITPFTTDMKQPQSTFDSVRRAVGSSAKTWATLNLQLMEKPLSVLAPKLQEMASMSLSVLNQDYLGDINIIRPPLYWPPAKLLSPLTADEISMLIEMGERTSWPKIEMVRLQTAISRKLEHILMDYDAAGAGQAAHPQTAVGQRKRRSRKS